MKAVVFHGIGDIRLDNVDEPRLSHDTDAIVRLTASAICGTDLHMVRGTMPGMMAGTILGHEGVGIVEAVGKKVTDFSVGDRVVIPSTICCGECSYCKSGYQSQCDHANPNGPTSGTAFFGGPKLSGPINGLQAELARVPLANSTLLKLPKEVSDDQAILLSDIFPTGDFGADGAEIKQGDSVAVFGCGPVGLFAIVSAMLRGAAMVYAVDRIADRLSKAAELGAIPVNFDEVHPVTFLKDSTKGIGVLRAIDAVGVDAVHANSGPATSDSAKHAREFRQEVKAVTKEGTGSTWGGNWVPGNAPSQVLDWAVNSLAKAGTLSIIGVYPETMVHFPIGIAMNKNLTLQMGNCPHRKYIPHLIQLVAERRVDPTKILTNIQPMKDAISAYRSFDKRETGWIKVELKPASAVTPDRPAPQATTAT